MTQNCISTPYKPFQMKSYTKLKRLPDLRVFGRSRKRAISEREISQGAQSAAYEFISWTRS
jgi:hypothetical protein